MRSRVIGKCRDILGVLYEKIMERLHQITRMLEPRSKGSDRLTEEYIIHERYAGEDFVRDFLNERTRNILRNRYSIKVKTGSGNAPTETGSATIEIGKVRLMRKKNLIDEATLIIKEGENNIIYWKFNK